MTSNLSNLKPLRDRLTIGIETLSMAHGILILLSVFPLGKKIEIQQVIVIVTIVDVALIVTMKLPNVNVILVASAYHVDIIQMIVNVTMMIKNSSGIVRTHTWIVTTMSTANVVRMVS